MITPFQKIKHDHQGFTLVELLIVAAVLLVLGSIAVVAVTRSQRAARDTQVVYDLNQLQTALEYYYTEHGRYPAVADGDSWTNVDTPGLAANLKAQLDRLPQPPRTDNGETYTYVVSADGSAYYLGAHLENSTHTAFSNDVDTTIGGRDWKAIASDNAVDTTDPQLNCDDAQKMYCVSSSGLE